jgi:8-oxo-dGTP pyrophosphatase MutT (NUDIX family)
MTFQTSGVPRSSPGLISAPIIMTSDFGGILAAFVGGRTIERGRILTAANFLASRAPLLAGHAVAALLVLEDGRYIVQLRDDIPNIWYPGHWGLFGGGVDAGEDELAALRRELREELELEVTEARLFATIDYDLQSIGLDCYFRRYYEVPVTIAAWNRVVLHEGSDVRALTGDEALSLPRISPYDAFALFLHHNRQRLKGSIYAPARPA